jgi:thiamine pyrophosphate-dependent acetolactate synthase large subunit-like protein
MAAASELHTVATLGLGGFVILAWANDGSSMIRNGVQHQQLDVPAELHTWASPSFAKIAEGFGLRGAMVRTAESLRDAVREGMGASAPLLVHAVIDPEAEIPGAADRFDDLNESWRSE